MVLARKPSKLRLATTCAALFFPCSRYDAAALEWLHQRSATVVAVGADLPDAKLAVRYRHEDEPDVALLAEPLVAELVATTWWAGVG